MSNKAKLLNDEFGLIPVIGAELEFYVVSLEHAAKFDPSPVNRYLAEFGIPPLEQEEAESQFEVKLPIFDKATELIELFYKVKQNIVSLAAKQNCKIIYDAKPYKEMPSSGLHFHVNFTDYSGKNIFAISDDILQNAIAGLLEDINVSLSAFIGSYDDLKKFLPYQKPNGELKKQKSFIYYPENISWGYNNRTTALRIISGKEKEKRIEHRVPCPNCNLEAALDAIFTAIYNGIKYNKKPFPPIYGNAHDDIYDLERIITNPALISEVAPF